MLRVYVLHHESFIVDFTGHLIPSLCKMSSSIRDAFMDHLEIKDISIPANGVRRQYTSENTYNLAQMTTRNTGIFTCYTLQSLVLPPISSHVCLERLPHGLP